MKKSKQAYYDKYFERYWNNIKNMWRRIKSLISLTNLASDTVSNPYDIANAFNNYFVSIAETRKNV